MIPLEAQGHTVPHLKAIRYGIYERRGLSCGGTSSIYQDFLKSDNLLHKKGFVDFQLEITVHKTKKVFWVTDFSFFLGFWDQLWKQKSIRKHTE